MSYMSNLEKIRQELEVFGLQEIEKLLTSSDTESKGITVTMQSGEDRDRVRYLLYCLLNIYDAKKYWRVKMVGPTSLAIASVLRDRRPGTITQGVISQIQNRPEVEPADYHHMSHEEALSLVSGQVDDDAEEHL